MQMIRLLVSNGIGGHKKIYVQNSHMIGGTGVSWDSPRIHSHLFSKAPHGNHDQNNRLYNSLNWDDYNAETHPLLTGVPGSSEFCQIGIGTDTLSVGINMPAIVDAILVGDIDDADEGFHKLG
jgi:hypothetical protein